MALTDLPNIETRYKREIAVVVQSNPDGGTYLTVSDTEDPWKSSVGAFLNDDELDALVVTLTYAQKLRREDR